MNKIFSLKDSLGFLNKTSKSLKVIFADYIASVPGSFDGLVYIKLFENAGYLFLNHELPYPEGAVTRLTYHNGAIIKNQIWKKNLARPCSSHKTPWNTILTNEEFMSDNKELGFVYELDPHNINNYKKLKRLGRMWHENTLPVPDNSVPGGYYFLTTDDRSQIKEGGSLYKFVPDNSQNLTKGNLYVYQTEIQDGWLKNKLNGYWFKINDPINIKENNDEGTPYYKMEDLEYNPVDKCVYICVGGMKDGNLGGIYKFNTLDNTMERWLKCEETEGKLINPDNIEIDNKGNLYIGEDKTNYNINLYGNNSLVKINYNNPYQIEKLLIGKDNIGEVTGILLNPEHTKLWVNWQNGYNLKLNKYFNEIIELEL